MTYDPYDSRSVSGYESGGGGKMTGRTKIYLIGGGVGAIAIWWWWSKKKAAAATAATDSSSTDTSSTDYSTDPNAYGSGYTPALTSYVDPATGAVISGGGYMGNGGYLLPGTTYAPSTNAEWAQQAIAFLGQEGYDPVSATTAIGLYLAGRTLTNSQYEIVQAAIGAEGPTPVAVAPPQLTPPAGQGTGTGVTGTTNAHPAAPVDLHVVSQRKGTAVLGWHPMPNATQYIVYFRGVPYGRVTRANATVHVNGVYEVSSVRGTYVSPRTAITVKGI